MSDNERSRKNKKTVRNIIYSFLVFYVSFFIFIEALDHSALKNPSIGMKLNAKDFLAIGLSIAAGIVFFKWYAKRNLATTDK